MGGGVPEFAEDLGKDQLNNLFCWPPGLREAIERHPRSVLIGPRGAGKTMVLRKTFYEYSPERDVVFLPYDRCWQFWDEFGHEDLVQGTSAATLLIANLQLIQKGYSCQTELSNVIGSSRALSGLVGLLKEPWRPADVLTEALDKNIIRKVANSIRQRRFILQRFLSHFVSETEKHRNGESVLLYRQADEVRQEHRPAG